MRTVVPKTVVKLFAGEKLLVGVSALGFLLAAVCAVYVGLFGEVVLPEGNMKDAFSFNAAIAMFVLSIAAILPFSGLSLKNRWRIRYSFAVTIIISYSIETVQNLRGFDPRYTQTGSIPDLVIGGFFGLTSILTIVLTVIVALSFFKRNRPNSFPLLTLGIRYAFVSTMLAFAGGIMMIVLQSRFVGADGNFIVMHGFGFHALQALLILGWLLERTNAEKKRNRLLIHTGGAAWCASVILLGIQTVLGRTVFEWSLLPLLSATALFVYLTVFSAVFLKAVKPRLFRAVQPINRP